jgi:hemolysin activation/secretion protein
VKTKVSGESLGRARWLTSWLVCAWLLGFASQPQAQIQKPPPAPRFAIEQFVVEGNTLLAADEVQALVGPFTGPDQDFGHVQRALEALQDAYLDRGYNAVRVLIPEQSLTGGKVRLRVIEAQLREVRVEGNEHFDEANIRASMPSLTTGESPNVQKIGRNAQLVQENPAKQVSVRLEAAPDEGKVDAVVRVKDEDPQGGVVFLDNTGTPQTGNLRLGIGYRHANVFDSDHVFTAQFITAPESIDKVKIYGAGYRVPLYGYNSLVDFFAGYSDVDSGQVADLFAVTGAGTVAGVRYSYILPRISSYEQKLSLGWDYRDYKQGTTLVGTSTQLLPDYTVRPITLAYTGRQSTVGRDWFFVASWSQNVPGGADGSDTAIQAQRFGANPRYNVWRLTGAYTQAFAGDLLFRTAFNAQYSHNALVPAEQFGMGGANSVRGFYEREVANDHGYRFAFEGYSPDLGKQIGEDWRARFLVFYDVAQGRDNSPIRVAENSLGSVGIGLRVTQGKALSLRLDFASVVDGAGARQDGANRVHFAGVYSF